MSDPGDPGQHLLLSSSLIPHVRDFAPIVPGVARLCDEEYSILFFAIVFKTGWVIFKF